jgi:vacuolar-type H+-ATPase subunit E/Vma4
MSLDRVEAAVMEEARAEAAGLLSAARAQLAERVAAAGREVAERFEQRRRREMARLEGEHLRKVSAARTAARLDVLREKNRLVERAFDLALEQLAALPREEFLRQAEAWLAQVPPDQPGEILAGPRERGFLEGAFLERVNSRRTGRLTLSAEPGPPGGGLVVRAERFEYDFTWRGQLADRRGALSPLVAGLLFGRQGEK